MGTRAVLVSAKTMPCPNKLGHSLAPNGARCRPLSLVGTSATLAVTRWRILEETRQNAPNDAKKRQPTPQNANPRHAATTRDEKRQEVSRVGSFMPAVFSRSCSPRNFSGGKTDNRDRWGEDGRPTSSRSEAMESDTSSGRLPTGVVSIGPLERALAKRLLKGSR